jgi:hypothetical protein
MSGEITIRGKKARKGERMTSGTGWRLAKITGNKLVFAGTLLKKFNFGPTRIAVFSVPKSMG